MGGANATKIAMLNQGFKDHYREVGETYKVQGKLTMDRVEGSGCWPFLKVKAAASRRLIRFSLKLVRESNTGSTHDELRLAVVLSMSRVNDIIETVPSFLPAELRNKIRE